MPNKNTFAIPPIEWLLKEHLYNATAIVDPFARNSSFGTITNDLSPDTDAQYHMDAIEFMGMLIAKGVTADAVLLDPPYSPRQISESYQKVGRAVTAQDTQNARLYKACVERMKAILKPGGIAIRCGWNSAGFGADMEWVEILMVSHGGAHNDTIVTVQRKPFLATDGM